MLKYYDKAMCSNNIQHNMTEGTKQQHTNTILYYIFTGLFLFSTLKQLPERSNNIDAV